MRPYFETIVEWYQALHVGQRGGVLQEIVDRRLGDPFFGIFLNPGHQIHLDEWVNTPVGPGSTVELASGMAMQVDVIPATGTPYFTTNIEDGIVLADEGLRRSLSTRLPRDVGPRSWPDATSCVTVWESTSTTTCCHCPTSRRSSPRSSSTGSGR